jgi:hypothetical protein
VRARLEGVVAGLVDNYTSKHAALLAEILPDGEAGKPAVGAAAAAAAADAAFDAAALDAFVARLSDFDVAMNGAVVDAGVLAGAGAGQRQQRGRRERRRRGRRRRPAAGPQQRAAAALPSAPRPPREPLHIPCCAWPHRRPAPPHLPRIAGMSTDDVAAAASKVALKEGCRATLQAALAAGVPTHIVSVNWSRDFAAAALGLPTAGGAGDATST